VGGGLLLPHDEFYDTSMREAVAEIAPHARPGAHIVSESPALAGYYATRANRGDLVCEIHFRFPWLSRNFPRAICYSCAWPAIFQHMMDCLRRYISDFSSLSASRLVACIPVDVYQLDPATLQIVRESSTRLPVLVSTETWFLLPSIEGCNASCLACVAAEWVQQSAS